MTNPNPHIKLNAEDWLWATWRPYTPTPWPEQRPFDQTDACNRLLKKAGYSFNWQWHHMKIPVRQSRAEAHFWLMMMSFSIEKYSVSAKQVLADWGDYPFDGNISIPEITDLLGVKSSFRYKPELILPLVNLLSWDELFALIERNVQNEDFVRLGTNLALGFRMYLRPYITPAERQEIRQRLRQHITSPLVEYVNYRNNVTTAVHPSLLMVANIGGIDDLLLTTIEGSDYYHMPLVLGLSDPEKVKELVYTKRDNFVGLGNADYLRGLLAHIELDAAEIIYWVADTYRFSEKSKRQNVVKVLQLIEEPTAAPYMLRLIENLETSIIARQWLTQHPDLAATGLTPIAADTAHKDHVAARNYVRLLLLRGESESVTAVAQTLTPDQQAILQTEVFDYVANMPPTFSDETTPDWLATAVASIHKIKRAKKPNWLDIVELPTLNIDGYTLNNDQGDALLIALNQIKKADNQLHPLVVQVGNHATPESRIEFAWVLFQLWLKAGAPSKEKWAMFLLGFWGNDDIALRLTPLIRKWPGESQHARAVLGLGVLEQIGTDTALMQINGIAQKVKYKALKKRAQEAIQAIAKAQNMTADELADRIVPDCGLDERGQTIFDYGRRQFTFVLTPDMKPMVRDEAGKLRANLPKPGKLDDAELAPAANQTWKVIKKQVRDVAKTQAIRLEQAMVTQRRWSVRDFERFFVTHPLMINLTRLLLWGGYDTNGQLTQTFRVTDERDYANVDDGEVGLDNIVQVGIVHPLELDEPTAVAWGEMLSDYALVPPFPQLGRETYALSPEEVGQTDITRFADSKIDARALVGALTRLGWQRGVPQDGGVYYEHAKPFANAGVTAVVEYDGVPIGYLEGWEDQSLKQCFFIPEIYNADGWYPDHKKRLKLNKIPAIVISETLRDLHIIVGKGK